MIWNNVLAIRAVARLLYQGGGQAVDRGGQAKFSKYFNLAENHLKLVLKLKKIILQINTKIGKFVKNFKQKFEKIEEF